MVRETAIEQGIPAKKQISRAGMFFCLLILFELPVSVLIGWLIMMFPGKYSSLISILVTQCYLVIGALLYVIIMKTGIVRDLQLRSYKLSTFFLSLVLLVTAAPMSMFLNIISQLFAKNEVGTAVFDITQNVPLLAGIFLIGCLPGFVEELIYRGILFTAFKRHSVFAGIVVSALSFGLMHMNFNQMLYAVYLGVIFALVVEATGSLLSTMILHMLFNAANTVYMYMVLNFMDGYATADVMEMMNQTQERGQLILASVVMAPIAVGGVALTVLLLKAIAKINGRTLTMASIFEKKAEVRPVTVPLVIGWCICLIFCVLNLFAA